MDQNKESKLDLKQTLTNFYNSNKLKIYFFLATILIIFIFIIVIKFFDDKKNVEISEKYIQAGIHLSTNNTDNAKKIYEEIILSKNKFYSFLALNSIIENNLINKDEKILNYFEIVENSISTKEQRDLVVLKKALFLIKKTETDEGEKLLKNLINNESHLKAIAEEIIK